MIVGMASAVVRWMSWNKTMPERPPSTAVKVLFTTHADELEVQRQSFVSMFQSTWTPCRPTMLPTRSRAAPGVK